MQYVSRATITPATRGHPIQTDTFAYRTQSQASMIRSNQTRWIRQRSNRNNCVSINEIQVGENAKTTVPVIFTILELVATKLLSASFPSNPMTICLLDREIQQFPLWRTDQLRPQIHPSRGNNDAVGVDGVRRSPSSFFSTFSGRLHFVRNISAKSIEKHA